MRSRQKETETARDHCFLLCACVTEVQCNCENKVVGGKFWFRPRITKYSILQIKEKNQSDHRKWPTITLISTTLSNAGGNLI